MCKFVYYFILFAQKYLQNFGWLDITSIDDTLTLDSDQVITALQNFQAFAAIPQTGKVDATTVNVMTLPRCGETDTDIVDEDVETVDRSQGHKVLRRNKRFVLQGTRWKTRELKYNISKYTNDISHDEVDKIISSAFRQWENVANISFFKATQGKIHIDIRFEKRYHNDEEVNIFWLGEKIHGQFGESLIGRNKFSLM